MINLLKKFKNLTNDLSTVTRLAKNVVFIKTIIAEIKLTGSDIEQIFKPLDFNLDYKYTNLLKGNRQIIECTKDEVFNNVSSSQIICENLELPQIKMDNIRPVEQITNHAFVFDGCLWVTDSHYLLRSELNISKDIKLNIPAHIFNLLKKIVWIGKKDNIIQISGWIDSKHQIVIQYNALQTEVIERYISMLKRVSSPLDICDDGIIYDLTEVTNLKLSSQRMKNLIRYNDGLISVFDNTFKYNVNEFKHDLFNGNLKKFTVDASYLKMFKKLFKQANIKTLGTLSGRTTSITLHDNNNSLLLMCIYE